VICRGGFLFFRFLFFHTICHTTAHFTLIMFLPPKNEAAVAETKAAEQARREAYSRIEHWAIDAIPANYRRGAVVSVQEVVCGDPSCSPVDTAIAILFEG
jgi:hypothetical protein